MRKCFRLLCVLFLSACASSGEFIDTFDHNKDWEAILPNLPAYPEAENLLEFDAGPATQLRYFIDSNSISVDEKRIIRYSLVIRSPQGAENVSFEGLRCETRERKRYALGNRETRAWTPTRVSEWETLEQVKQLHAQRELAKYYFCPRGLVVGSANEAILALRAGIHPKVRR